MPNFKIPAYRQALYHAGARQAGKSQMKSKSQISKPNLQKNLITLSFGI
jgi:hypothetical protein